MIKRVRPENISKELLVKAVKIKSEKRILHVVDATAGLGEDAFLIAAAGFKVTMFEYNNIICNLLLDALKRGLNNPQISEIISRMELVEKDSTEGIKSLSEPVDVVYLDPMFPQRKKSGLIKKKFQLLQNLERPCENEDALFQAALESGTRKIVVKRPKNAPALAGAKEDFKYEGSTIRYDCYMVREAPSRNPLMPR